MFQNIFIKLILLISTLLVASAAQAHSVKILAYVDDNTVFTESYFFDGKAVRNGLVYVYDSRKKMILEGRTDNFGAFAFHPPVADDLTIVVREMTGHRNTCRVSKDQFLLQVSQR